MLVFPLGEAHGRVEVDVVREECLEGWSDGWERANELLLAGRMLPSKLMCANAECFPGGVQPGGQRAADVQRALGISFAF